MHKDKPGQWSSVNVKVVKFDICNASLNGSVSSQEAIDCFYFYYLLYYISV